MTIDQWSRFTDAPLIMLANDWWVMTNENATCLSNAQTVNTCITPSRFNLERARTVGVADVGTGPLRDRRIRKLGFGSKLHAQYHYFIPTSNFHQLWVTTSTITVIKGQAPTSFPSPTLSNTQMICVVFGQSRLHTLTIILYTCFWLPLSHLKEAMLNAIRAVFDPFGPREVVRVLGQGDTDGFDSISMASFGEFAFSADASVDGMCSICLQEFDREDLVGWLPGCRHLFHAACITRWLDQERFTCPLCRSGIF